MSYNRKIFYMNFYEGDEKRGNAGYVKVLQQGEVFEAEVHLTGVSPLFDGGTELEISRGQEHITAQKIAFRNGQGAGRCRWEMSGGLSELAFYLPVNEGCYFGTEEMKSRSMDMQLGARDVLEEIIPEAAEDVVAEETVIEVENPQEEIVEMTKDTGSGDRESKDTKGKVESRKWKQICKVYPHIKPFDDFREYIKLDLKDMVLVSEKKYSLVENSFLLHGYYNYNHIILWKKEKTPVKYYIGVPGNFYEKEKQVAVLYGFESFEGVVEPAKEGDFGYYMTEVSI